MLLARGQRGAGPKAISPRASTLVAELLQSGRSYSHIDNCVHVLSYAALLARDEACSPRWRLDAGERSGAHSIRLRRLHAYNARHRLELLEGQPSSVRPRPRRRRPRSGRASCGTLWLTCREAIDAGDVEMRSASGADMEPTGSPWTSQSSPRSRQPLPATKTAGTTRSALALDHDLRLIAVDALEGLAIAASRAESWAECMRLLGAADRLRAETGYRWRFIFEQQAIDAALAGARGGLADGGVAATGEGNDLDWRVAASYARRARGERGRPRHGWASLTPTEQQVVGPRRRRTNQPADCPTIC